MEKIDKLLKKIIGLKKQRQIKAILYEVAYILTGKKIWFWQLNQIERLLKEAGFESKENEIKAGDFDILPTTCWIGARINQTPHQVATNMIIQEVEIFIKEISKKILQDSMSLLRAYHSPALYAEEIVEDLRSLSKTEQEETKLLKQNPRKSFKELFIQTYGAK
jgi:hypothetical protein